MPEAHAGRLLDHVHLRVRDVEASKRFYAGALEPLGLGITSEGEGWFSADELFVSGDGEPHGRPAHRIPGARSRDRRALPCSCARRGRARQRPSGRPRLPPRLLRGVRARPGRNERRGRVSRARRALRRLRRLHLGEPVIRLLVRLLIAFVANAVGLIVAALVLDRMSLNATGFLVAVAVFTVVFALMHPFLVTSLRLAPGPCPRRRRADRDAHRPHRDRAAHRRAVDPRRRGRGSLRR